MIMDVPGGYSTFKEAKRRACAIAHLRQELRFVVCEAGIYFTATEEDLDTFFLGCEPVYCTADED